MLKPWGKFWQESSFHRARPLSLNLIIALLVAMAVLPACDQIDLTLLKEAAKAERAELASEVEFGDRFPECETGAMPPFGNLYGMRVFVELRLTRDKDIAFNAGTHTELIRLALDDFSRLARPTIAKFSTMRAHAKVA